MSISGALSNARTGLTAAARAAEVVSANVANALTPGYGRRELELSAQSLGGNGTGVRIEGIRRTVDQPIIAERRLADAGLADQAARADFLARIEQAIGTPDDPRSLTGRINALEASLIQAASRPDSLPRLQETLDAASALAGALNAASDTVQAQRMEADREIARQVERLNKGLENIALLNRKITTQLGAGRDATALMDQRQQEVDRIASIVPLREVPRDRGQIALYTPGGAILLDGAPATLSFTPAGVIVPEMSVASGALSEVSLNGRILPAGEGGPLAGGNLGALFYIRDNLAIDAQGRLDALARDLVERFADPATDPTLGPTDPGLLTDAGSIFDPANELGLSGRITVNPLADPRAGGTLLKLRDGLGAAPASAPGDATRLLALADALTASRVPASTTISNVARSASGLSSDVASFFGNLRLSAEADQSFASALADGLRETELQGGVDSDFEMQQLLLVEQAFSANARVISTIDDLIQTLLGL